MNIVEELQSLDVNDVGRWPAAFRAAVIFIVFLGVVGLGIWFTIIKDKSPQLQRAVAEEQEYRLTFENKQRKAANYDAYKAQLSQIEQSFGTMLRQLPGKTEIPSLIVDISQTGLAAGLQEKLFIPQSEIPRDFYAEKPIKIRLTGGYHEIGNFVSGIAALPRQIKMGTSLNFRHVLVVALVSFSLSACGGGSDDLDVYINQIKARPGGRIEPLPEITPYETFSYIADRQGIRSPFRPDTPQSAGGGSGPRPDVERSREYLESFPLDTLGMVGTLHINETMYGLVQRITEISESSIGLVEIISDGIGGYIERDAAVGLSD